MPKPQQIYKKMLKFLIETFIQFKIILYYGNPYHNMYDSESWSLT
jgi:hypothetical protein